MTNRLARIRLAAQKADKDDQALVAMIALLDPAYVLKMLAVIDAAWGHPASLDAALCALASAEQGKERE